MTIYSIYVGAVGVKNEDVSLLFHTAVFLNQIWRNIFAVYVWFFSYLVQFWFSTWYTLATFFKYRAILKHFIYLIAFNDAYSAKYAKKVRHSTGFTSTNNFFRIQDTVKDTNAYLHLTANCYDLNVKLIML